jgi:hypothetical protein
MLGEPTYDEVCWELAPSGRPDDDAPAAMCRRPCPAAPSRSSPHGNLDIQLRHPRVAAAYYASRCGHLRVPPPSSAQALVDDPTVKRDQVLGLSASPLGQQQAVENSVASLLLAPLRGGAAHQNADHVGHASLAVRQTVFARA